MNRSGGRLEWLYAWVLPVLAILAAAFVPVLWDLEPIANLEQRLKSLPSLASAVLLLVAVALTVVQGVHSTKESRRIRGTLETFNHALGDTVRALGYLIDSDKGPLDREAFFRSMVSEAKAVIPLESPRVCVYELEAADEESGEEDFLRLTTFGGRLDPPRSRFEGNTEHGQAAIQVAKGTVLKCVDDHRKAPIQVDRDPDAVWHSFMMVPLHVDGYPRGLLTIDTTKATTFSLEQMAVARTVGRFIEIGMKGVSEAARMTDPEVRSVRSQLSETESERQGIRDAVSGSFYTDHMDEKGDH